MHGHSPLEDLELAEARDAFALHGRLATANALRLVGGLLARLDAAEAERDRLREAATKADGALASCWCVAQDALAYGERRYGEDVRTCSPWTDLRDAADKASAARAALRGAREGGLIHTTGGVSCPKN